MKNNKEFLQRLDVKDISQTYIFPKYFEIETVNACNARCIMCTIDEWTGNDSQMMSDKLFDKFVEEVANYSDWIKIICLNRDGEPTLDKNIAQKVKKLKDIGIKLVRFVSNGQNLTQKLSRDILNAGIDEVMFSIDSVDKQTYEQIRIKLSYDKVMENTLNYMKLRDEINPLSRVTIRMVELPQNISQKQDWLKFWNDKISNADRAYTMPMHNWGNQLGEDNDKVKYYADKACISPFSSMAIHSDGKIGICGADYNTKNFMGDFSKDSIQDIWQNAKFSGVRQCHLNKNRNQYDICRGCDIWDRSYTS
jgi:radical SAM protein with 4Fe4S-binding SPASM domain